MFLFYLLFILIYIFTSLMCALVLKLLKIKTAMLKIVRDSNSFFLNLFIGGSSTASTKSATIEMYVGSSTGYNDTMSGETMSSISEKSGSYISDGGAGHDHQHQHHHHSTHHRHHIHHPTQPHLLHTTAVTTEFEVITFFVCYYTILP